MRKRNYMDFGEVGVRRKGDKLDSSESEGGDKGLGSGDLFPADRAF